MPCPVHYCIIDKSPFFLTFNWKSLWSPYLTSKKKEKEKIIIASLGFATKNRKAITRLDTIHCIPVLPAYLPMPVNLCRIEGSKQCLQHCCYLPKHPFLPILKMFLTIVSKDLICVLLEQCISLCFATMFWILPRHLHCCPSPVRVPNRCQTR